MTKYTLPNGDEVKYKIMGLEAELDILVNDILNCTDLKYLQEVTKKNFPNNSEKPNSSSEAQDNDGWIEWKGGEQPVGDNVLVEIKIRGGRYLYPALSGSWNWIWINNSEDIIAYRIIQEPKDTYKNDWMMYGKPNPAPGCAGTTIKEPKKQTLLEFAAKQDYDFYDLPPKGLIVLISEYLQTQGIGRD